MIAATKRTYADLLALAEAATPIPWPASPPTTEAIEDDDDPYRLARLFLATKYSHTDGPTLRLWREEWWAWRDGRYSVIRDRELKGQITLAIKEEFDRINIENQIDQNSDTGATKKVTRSLVNNVFGCIEAMVTVSGHTEQQRWLNRPDSDRSHWIAMKNGLLDINGIHRGHWNFKPLSPLWFSPVFLPYDCNAEAECPKWMNFVNYNLEGDQERIAILQEWFGYCLTNTLHETKFMILGGDGSNGKTVILAALEAMLGGKANCSFVALELFGERFQLTGTLGKLANICGDAGEIDKVAEGHIKAYTDGNPMTFDRKGISAIEGKPTAKLIIACNNLPRFNDKTDGIWRRILLMPLRIKIAKTQRIRGMKEAEWWHDSGELPGIFAWALQGLIRLQESSGFTESEVCNQALNKYREENSPIRMFLKSTCVDAPACSIPSSELYTEYRAWATAHGYWPASDISFGTELARIFPNATKKRLGGRNDRFMSYVGIGYEEGFVTQVKQTTFTDIQKQFA